MLYLFNFIITPSDKGYWIDIRNMKETIEANTLDEAVALFVEMLEEKYFVTISKTARKNPRVMYRDRNDGRPEEIGRVFKASMEIDYGDGSCHADWRRKWCDVWTEVYTLSNVFYKQAE